MNEFKIQVDFVIYNVLMRIFFLFSFENFLCVYINILFIYGKNIIYNIEIKKLIKCFYVNM